MHDRDPAAADREAGRDFTRPGPCGGQDEGAADPSEARIRTHRRDLKIGTDMIVLGAILLIIGLLVGVSLLTTVGGVLVVVGAVLWILGASGRQVGGRRHYF
ncbi:hypothetical protein GCM10009612_50240 [Streptomyces beijiangensis]